MCDVDHSAPIYLATVTREFVPLAHSIPRGGTPFARCHGVSVVMRAALSMVPVVQDGLTLDAYASVFVERYSQALGKTSWQNDRGMLDRMRAFPLDANGTRFGSKPIRSITEDDVERFMEHLRHAGRAASTRNQYLQVFKAMSGWGVRKGYLVQPWIGPLSGLKREKIARRRRRVSPDEESRVA